MDNTKFHTPHIKAVPGDFAKTVLMPGDPLRAKFIAETFLTDAKLVNNVRGIQGYTGLSQEEARLFHLELWACVHGIATMFATGFLDLPWELVSRMTSDVYLGLKTQYERKES